MNLGRTVVFRNVRSAIGCCLLGIALFPPPVSFAGDSGTAGNASTGNLPMIVAVHVPSWDVRMGPGTDGNSGDMPVDSIDFNTMTHFISFAAAIETSGTAMKWNNLVSSRRKPLNDRAHAKGKPALLCIGGSGSDSYLTKALSPATRGTTINTILSAVRTYGYDGIDWDWEPFSTSDSALLYPVIRALHDSFQTMNAAWDPTRRPIQTADINPAGGSQHARLWLPVAPYLEFIMLMSYDKIGSWTEMVYFDYAPYSRINNVIVDRMPGGGQEMATAQRQALQMTEAGWPAAKVVAGIDFMAGMASGGTGTWAGGATWPRQRWSSLPTFSADYKFDTFYQQYLDTASAAIKHWDDTAKVYFLSIDKSGSSNDRFIGYAGGPGQDSTLYYHIKLAKDLGIGGIMVWDLSESYLGTGKFPSASYPNLERNWLTHQLHKHLLEDQPPPPPPPPPIDTTAPSISFISPSDGDSLLGTITAAASASDNVGVSRVQFLLDGVALGNPDSSAPYTLLWDTELHSDTIHTLSAVAHDAAGLEGRADISVRLISPPPPPPPPPPDTLAPTVAFVRPADGDSLLGTVTVEASASDNVGVKRVQFLLDGAALGSPDSTAPYSMAWNTDLHPDGNHSLSVIAYDSAGLQGSAAITVRLISPPPPPPVIPLTYNRLLVEFGNVVTNVAKRDSVELINQNNFAVALTSVTSSSPRFTIQTTQMSVGANSSTRIYVTFKPTSRTTVTGLLIARTSANVRIDTATLRGTGIRKPASTAHIPVGPEEGIPSDYSLSQNYPNPFNPVTIIGYALPEAGHVRIAVYDLLGREVAVPVDRYQEAGYGEVAFDASTLPSGVYLYSLEARTFTETKKMLLIQ